jgi:hypothetical protein
VSACTSGGLASPDASSSHASSPAASRSASSAQAGEPFSTPTTAATATATPGTVVTGLLTLRFDSPLAADPAQAKVIAGFRASILLEQSDQALHLAPGATSYLTGGVLAGLKYQLSVESQDGKVPAGELAYYLTQVTHMLAPAGATRSRSQAPHAPCVSPTSRVAGSPVKFSGYVRFATLGRSRSSTTGKSFTINVPDEGPPSARTAPWPADPPASSAIATRTGTITAPSVIARLADTERD